MSDSGVVGSDSELSSLETGAVKAGKISKRDASGDVSKCGKRFRHSDKSNCCTFMVSSTGCALLKKGEASGLHVVERGGSQVGCTLFRSCVISKSLVIKGLSKGSQLLVVFIHSSGLRGEVASELEGVVSSSLTRGVASWTLSPASFVFSSEMSTSRRR